MEAPDTALPRLRVGSSAAAHLASKGNLPGFYLTAAANALFGIYQYWVHQNPCIHTDVGINKDGKLQAR